MANLQKDGTYSVVPRVPGGEITPQGLIDIGQVAADFGLYTKITGGQRIDLFGARLEQLPAIWQRLVDAGLRVRARLRQGAAHGEVVRRVARGAATASRTPSALAIDLELRYRGLRSPHKIKLGVSGCARECAEARSKDVGVIATEKGWNLYVGGNGGFTPRHAQLFAEDLDTDDAGPDDRPVPDVLRPHRRPAAAHGCLGRGPRGRHRGDRRRGHRRQPRHRRRPRRGDGHATSTATSTSGRRPSRTRRSCAQFVSFVNAPETPDDRRVGGAIDNRDGTAHRRPDSGGTPMTIAADRTTWTRVCSLDQLIPERGVAALVGSDAGRGLPARRRQPCTPSATATRSATPT